MSAIAEAEKLALSLSESERGKLANKLIASLKGPSTMDDDDDGVDEALRRSREMDENPEMSLSAEQFDKMIRERFPECVSD